MPSELRDSAVVARLWEDIREISRPSIREVMEVDAEDKGDCVEVERKEDGVDEDGSGGRESDEGGCSGADCDDVLVAESLVSLLSADEEDVDGDREDEGDVCVDDDAACDVCNELVRRWRAVVR